jgi:hypothetical protein
MYLVESQISQVPQNKEADKMSNPAIDEEMTFDRATKRMFRFNPVNDASGMGTTYFPKMQFEEEPKRIRVVVEVIE